MTVPAEMLVGLNVSKEWKVVSRVAKQPGATGSVFSVGYLVESQTGRRAFLKALNLARALRQPNWPVVVQAMLETFNFESQLLAVCRHHDRIVTAIDEGEVDVDPSSPIGRVPYLIFELGEGDIRRHIAVTGKLETAWALRCLHHISVGIAQLHGMGVAHQDLKPSNVLTFGDAGSRVGDLGCASMKGANSPIDQICPRRRSGLRAARVSVRLRSV
jgi:eukaryotic-like serine/threonine-protein kinase